MAAAAQELLASLDAEQRATAHWPFPSDAERRRWFYTPTDHGGLTLADMTARQQQLTHQLVASGLSRAGYVTVATIMGLENVLDQLESYSLQWDWPRGRDPQRYFLRVFGDPGDVAGTWSWRFGGHHVSLHLTVVAGALAAVTPCFLGADPASAPLLGTHELRPLAGIEDGAFALLGSLDPAQLARAVISPVAPSDLVLGNRSAMTPGDRPPHLRDVWRHRFEDGSETHELLGRLQTRADAALGYEADHAAALEFTATPKGLAVADLTATQRAGFDELLGQYVHRLPDEIAELELAKLHGGDADLHLAWAGGTRRGEPHYYRIQGTHVVVEYDNTQRDANHVHSVWRDPADDFGAGALARHYAEHHQER
jgi:hypothetical protein